MTGLNRKNGNIFIERSIENALSFFKGSILSDDIARSKGLLQSMDPSARILALLALIILTCFVTSIPFIAALYALSVILAVFSRINVAFFIKRVWIFIPIFTLFMAIPAIFMQSFYSASIFVLRVVTCVSFAVLASVTTRHRDLLRSLGWFCVPSVFIQVLDMTYRYIFLFISVFQDMHLSLKSRLLKDMEGKAARGWVASRISYLFKRSIRMSEDVYLAMIARGYTGDFKKYGE